MNEEQMAGGDDDLEGFEPGTDSDPDLGGEPLPAAIPVADAAPSPEPPAPLRVFPQHYTLILGSAFLFASGAAVWQRVEIFGADHALRGGQSIPVTALAGLALYGLAVGVANSCTGRVPRLRFPLFLGLLGLVLGVMGFLGTWAQERCLGWDEMEKHLVETTGSNFQTLSRAWFGQFAPGVWLATLGGLFTVGGALRMRMVAKGVDPDAAGGPRVFPQHFSMLFGASLVAACGAATWERASIFSGGVEVVGFASVSVSILFALALHSVVVGVSNIATGRLRGMLSSFLAGAAGLYFGIKGLLATWGQAGCLDWNAMGERLKGYGDDGILQHATSWLGQFAPGLWVATVGGAVIVLVFVKAIVGGGGGKKAAAPASSSGSRRRSR